MGDDYPVKESKSVLVFLLVVLAVCLTIFFDTQIRKIKARKTSEQNAALDTMRRRIFMLSEKQGELRKTLEKENNEEERQKLREEMDRIWEEFGALSREFYQTLNPHKKYPKAKK